MQRNEAFQKFIHYREVKQLADRVLILQEQEKFHSIALLSEFNGEGKTFVTAALAFAFSERLKKKVLVVDTSTAAPISAPVPAKERQSHDLLGELLEEADQVDVIALREWSGMKKGSQPDEYQLKALLSQIGTPYSLVLVDTSALARKNRNILDPIVIARHCDAAVLITGRQAKLPGESRENPADGSQENRARLKRVGD